MATAVVSTLGVALVNSTGVAHSSQPPVAFAPSSSHQPGLDSEGSPLPAPAGHAPDDQQTQPATVDDRAARAGKDAAEVKHDEALARLTQLLETRRIAAERASRQHRLTLLHWVRPDVGPLTQRYGGPGGHPGIDLAGPYGSHVLAAYRGTVIYASWEEGYGNFIQIRHPDGVVTCYGHLSAILVRVGDQVEAGQMIGNEGSTGYSTGPHLHFEVMPHGVDGARTDPLAWLAAHGVII